MGVAYSVGEVDHLYTFFVQWTPSMYSKGGARRRRFLIREKHHKRFLLVEKNKEAIISKLLADPSDPSVKNWEIITVKESKRRPSLCGSEESEESEEPEEPEELDDVLPVLSDFSQLLDRTHLESLASHLPARTQGHPWQLVYSSSVHGSSLKTLYRKMGGLESPVLLVVKDMQKKVFGAFSSDPFRVSHSCYGTGESFLFSFSPDFQAYRWSGENSYFVSGTLESLQMGGGGGGFGLWLDADLYHGASFSCHTFHNAPLSSNKDFIVQDLEVWTVQN